jgi:hypothetical protein
VLNNPIFEICAADTSVQSYLGDGPRLRFYPFGIAPQGEKRPYAVWQLVYGSPENYLSDVPDIDVFGTQIDMYGPDADYLREAAVAVRDALEPHAYVTAWQNESFNPDTLNYRVTFTVDWVWSR